MLVYPQLATGAMSQFPLQRRHRLRTLINTAADGTAVKLADPGAGTIEWQLKYVGLSDAELAALQQFYLAAEGSLQSFTFLDPTANLLAWSDDLSNAVWDCEPFLSHNVGIEDPLNGNNAWQVANGGAGPQVVSQTISTAPGGYVYCFSVYVRSAEPTLVTLLRGNSREVRIAGPDWRRVASTGIGDATASSVTFGIELEAGASVDLFGWQAEPQASPSRFKMSTTGGCYEDARLRDDTLAYTTTDMNRHSVTVNIIHASHL